MNRREFVRNLIPVACAGTVVGSVCGKNRKSDHGYGFALKGEERRGAPYDTPLRPVFDIHGNYFGCYWKKEEEGDLARIAKERISTYESTGCIKENIMTI